MIRRAAQRFADTEKALHQRDGQRHHGDQDAGDRGTDPTLAERDGENGMANSTNANAQIAALCLPKPRSAPRRHAIGSSISGGNRHPAERQ